MMTLFVVATVYGAVIALGWALGCAAAIGDNLLDDAAHRVKPGLKEVA